MSANVQIGAIVLDCPDPMALGGFYADLLGVSVTDDSDDSWVDLSGAGEVLSFQRVADYEAPVWPNGVPQQAHLDLTVDEFAQTHALAVSLGATPLDPVDPPSDGDGRTYRVYADPAGHPFCLCMC